jgi:hypothetical protein
VAAVSLSSDQKSTPETVIVPPLNDARSSTLAPAFSETGDKHTTSASTMSEDGLVPPVVVKKKKKKAKAKAVESQGITPPTHPAATDIAVTHSTTTEAAATTTPTDALQTEPKAETHPLSSNQARHDAAAHEVLEPSSL